MRNHSSIEQMKDCLFLIPIIPYVYVTSSKTLNSHKRGKKVGENRIYNVNERQFDIIYEPAFSSHLQQAKGSHKFLGYAI